MFKSQILFVVGAGASKEAELPTGSELTHDIAQKINIHKTIFGQWDDKKSDYIIIDALRKYFMQPFDPAFCTVDKRRDLDDYYLAASQIHDNMPQSSSIDTFIDTHRDNERIELCGKLAIARCILEDERKSKIYFDKRHNYNSYFNNMKDTLYIRFWQLLTDNLATSEINNIFDNVSFIVFNYDRCIEHFLMNATCSRYGIKEIEALKLFNKLKIYHPYGTVGKLQWQIPEVPVEFGKVIEDGITLLQISKKIKTFTQYSQDVPELNAMRRLVQNADIIVFFGFAFYEQNMEILKPIIPSKVRRIIATAKGISQDSCKQIEKQIRMNFGKAFRDDALKLDNKLTCADLLK